MATEFDPRLQGATAIHEWPTVAGNRVIALLTASPVTGDVVLVDLLARLPGSAGLNFGAIGPRVLDIDIVREQAWVLCDDGWLVRLTSFVSGSRPGLREIARAKVGEYGFAKWIMVAQGSARVARRIAAGRALGVAPILGGTSAHLIETVTAGTPRNRIIDTQSQRLVIAPVSPGTVATFSTDRDGVVEVSRVSGLSSGLDAAAFDDATGYLYVIDVRGQGAIIELMPANTLRVATRFDFANCVGPLQARVLGGVLYVTCERRNRVLSWSLTDPEAPVFLADDLYLEAGWEKNPVRGVYPSTHAVVRKFGSLPTLMNHGDYPVTRANQYDDGAGIAFSWALHGDIGALSYQLPLLAADFREVNQLFADAGLRLDARNRTNDAQAQGNFSFPPFKCVHSMRRPTYRTGTVSTTGVTTLVKDTRVNYPRPTYVQAAAAGYTSPPYSSQAAAIAAYDPYFNLPTERATLIGVGTKFLSELAPKDSVYLPPFAGPTTPLLAVDSVLDDVTAVLKVQDLRTAALYSDVPILADLPAGTLLLTGSTTHSAKYTIPGIPGVAYRLILRIRALNEPPRVTSGTAITAFGAPEIAGGFDPIQTQKSLVRNIRWGSWVVPVGVGDRHHIIIGDTPGEPGYAKFWIGVPETTVPVGPHSDVGVAQTDAQLILRTYGGQNIYLSLNFGADQWCIAPSKSHPTGVDDLYVDADNEAWIPPDDLAEHPLVTPWTPLHPNQDFNTSRQPFIQVDIQHIQLASGI